MPEVVPAPFVMVGDIDSEVCVDGVCAFPQGTGVIDDDLSTGNVSNPD